MVTAPKTKIGALQRPTPRSGIRGKQEMTTGMKRKMVPAEPPTKARKLLNPKNDPRFARAKPETMEGGKKKGETEKICHPQNEETKKKDDEKTLPREEKKRKKSKAPSP